MADVSLAKLSSMWLLLDSPGDKSTLVQVMAWCRQATSHYLSQCWLRSMLPYGITRPQWVRLFSCFRLQKVVKDLQKYVNSQDRGPWPQNKVSALDRALGEVARIMDKKVIRHVTLVAIAGTTILVPFRKSRISKWNLLVTDLQMSCRDFTA